MIKHELIGVAVIAFPLLWIGLYYWFQNYEWHIRIGMLPFAGIFVLIGNTVIESNESENDEGIEN